MNVISYIKQFGAGIIDPNSISIPTTNLSSNSKITELLNYSFGVLAAISFLVIVIAGVQFILSSGEPQKINTAKNAIIYAMIGLVIALSALVIVNFVLGTV
jgi:Type IV secretion system pilin